MIILVMGLPGSGKTHLAERLQAHLACSWFNADDIRKAANDWDFSPAGRIRQTLRMNNIAEFEPGTVICDFVCPTQATRSLFNYDILIWLDTIKEGRFDDTNKIFEPPTDATYIISTYLSDIEISQLGDKLV